MKGLLCTVFLMVTMWAGSSFAYEESPRFGAFEMHFGPHRLALDTVPASSDQVALRQMFDSSNLFRFGLELDWQFARIDNIVSFGLGMYAGFMRKEGKGQIETEAGIMPAADETAINVIPLALMGVIRVDVLADLLRIPFVPYFKMGPNWYLWWSRTADETDNHGGTPGFQINPGVAFRLDWIERSAARTFDNEFGVNHSYLFFELHVEWSDGFGDGGKFPFTPRNMGDTATWSAGICLEF